ncbi:MAG: group II intron reverse transcriptase/maturase [Thermoanaerobaculia bacterium]
MRDSQAEVEPASVPVRAKQAGEAQGQWSWVEPSVWTERMLTALESGVKGGRWYSLIDKVISLRNLESGFVQVKRNQGSAGVDRVTIKMFEAHLEENLQRLSASLREGSYRPQAIRRVWIRKPGSQEKRPLGIPTVRDRVVQAALRNVLEPIFERDFAAQSYGFRPKRGTKDALRRVAELLAAGYVHVVDADVQSYYDTIPRRPLLEQVGGKVADRKVLELLEAYLGQEVMESAKYWTPERGTPQGAVISPLLSNIYLDPLDHRMAQLGYEMVRYADDFVVLCRSQSEAQRALAEVEEWTTAAGLRLHPEKTRIVDATQRGGFDFLGYHFERGYRWPSPKSLRKFQDKIRAKTKRTNGHSLQRTLVELAPVQRGWFEYFKHSHWTTFEKLDKWIRMRLRSILRHRQKRKGRSRGQDHNRWPNAFFAEQGLFSLTTAYAQARQSSRR